MVHQILIHPWWSLVIFGSGLLFILSYFPSGKKKDEESYLADLEVHLDNFVARYDCDAPKYEGDDSVPLDWRARRDTAEKARQMYMGILSLKGPENEALRNEKIKSFLEFTRDPLF